MKKTGTVLIAFTIALFTSNLMAQGAYVNINAGYGFSMASQSMLGNSSNSYTENYGTGDYTSSGTYEVVNASFGKGLNFGGTFGYMFNEHVGAEVGVSYLLGGKTEGKSESTYKMIDYDGTTTTTTSTFTTTYSSTMLRFIPSVVIAAGLDGIDPYAKFGVVIGMGSVKSEEEGTDDGDVTVEKWKHSGGMGLGLNAALGANFSISDNMVFFAELNMVNMSYAPTKGEMTEATYNGKDVLPDLTTSQKEIEYVDSNTWSSSDDPSDSEPAKQLKNKLPFGSVGINVGLRIAL